MEFNFDLVDEILGEETLLKESAPFTNYHWSFGLPDVEKIIEKLKLKEVTSPNIFKNPADQEFDPKGLFSEEIFGAVGTYDRLEKFAYIDLTPLGKFLQPFVINAIEKHSTKVYEAVIGKKKLKFDSKKGELVETTEKDPEGMDSFKLVEFLIEKRNEIKNLSNHLKGLFNKYGSKVLTSKILVIPPDLRPIHVTERGINLDEINNIYISLIKIKRQNLALGLDETVGSLIWRQVQVKLLELHKTIKNTLAKKEGLIRENILGKRLDFTGRTVATNDSQIKPYQIGVPYRMCADIGRAFLLHTLMYKTSPSRGELYRKILAREFEIKDLNDLNFKLDLYTKGIKLDPKLEELIKEAIEISLRGKYVMVKRDPALHRDSWEPKELIPVEGMALRVNPIIAKPFNLDFDGDSFLGDVRIYRKDGSVAFEGRVSDLTEV